MTTVEPKKKRPRRPRYGRAPGRPTKPRGALASLRQLATPVLGSSALFPRYFDRAVQALLTDPSAPGVPPGAARAYFGPKLVFTLDPERLTRRLGDFVTTPAGLRWMGTSFLDAGSWKNVLSPVERSPAHQEMTAIVAADLDYRVTAQYQRQLDRIASGHPIERNGLQLATPDDLDAYYRYCVALIESVRRSGILPRSSFHQFATLSLKHRRVRPTLVDSNEGNIGVAITRTGALVRHLGGKHRTAIAQALQLTSIPVELQMVHVGWLSKEMTRTGLPAHKALAAFLERMQAEGADNDEASRESSGKPAKRRRRRQLAERRADRLPGD